MGERDDLDPAQDGTPPLEEPKPAPEGLAALGSAPPPSESSASGAEGGLPTGPGAPFAPGGAGPEFPEGGSSGSGPEAVDSSDARARRRDKVIGLGIVAVAFAVSMLISLWAKYNSAPPESVEPDPPTTAGLTGFPKKVDPVATLARARALTQRPLFRGFVAEGVGPSGLVDVSDKGSRIRYSFQSEPGRGAQPPREPGTLPSRTFCGRQSVVVTHEGIGAEPDAVSFPCTGTQHEALPEPKCQLSELWQRAKKKGAPPRREARIEYYRSPRGPAYRFSIPGTKHRWVVGADCERELTGKQALGSVP
jgi:hypothetical protein